MSSLQAQVGSETLSEDLRELAGLLQKAHSAWREMRIARPMLGQEQRVPCKPTVLPQSPHQRLSTRPLDVPTALAWSDQVTRYDQAYPRAATAMEITGIFENHAGRYLPSRQGPPLDDMVALRLAPLQWQEVFHQACKIKDREQRLGRALESPPPYNLILSLAQNQVKLRTSIESKRKRLTALRQSARTQEPS